MRLHQIFRYAIDIILPNRCPGCGKFIPWDEYICVDCAGKLSPANGLCKKCGFKKCSCGKNPPNYDSFISCFFYKGKAINGIMGMKTASNANFGIFCGQIIAGIVKLSKVNYDYIVPVPMNKKDKKLRGFNQAEIIAGEISRQCNIPVDNTILYKEFSSVKHHNLTAEERAKNVNSFKINLISLSGDKILLVDDVFTTGSIANHCSKLLKSNEAAYVGIATAVVTDFKQSANKDRTLS
ncbi:MAG: double zinc ribbon domain-containing protein [Ruminococcus sp.]|jgi:competence protein ComFC|nr:double zinc ribbon domain-containing protein [Ruminococcus sp.]